MPSQPRQRVLVAGASGALGRRLVAALAACDHDVYGLARSAGSAAVVERHGARALHGDLLDRAAVMAALEAVRPTVLIHQATALRRPARRAGHGLAATNRLRVEGTRNLADAAERYGVQRLVAQSVAFAYAPAGPPVVGEDAPLDVAAPGPWGAAVRAVARLEETVLGARQVQGLVLRYGRLYGPGTALASDGPFAVQVRRRRVPVLGGGGGRTSFLHIDDAVGATLDALDRGWGVLNIVDDGPAPVAEWLPAYAAALGAPPPRRAPAWLGALAGGRQAARAMTTQRGAANARARRELGWQPEFANWRDGFATLGGAA